MSTSIEKLFITALSTNVNQP